MVILDDVFCALRSSAVFCEVCIGTGRAQCGPDVSNS